MTATVSRVLFGWCAANQCRGTATARPCPGSTPKSQCTCECHDEVARELADLL